MRRLHLWTMVVLCLLTAPWHAWNVRRLRRSTGCVHRYHPDLAAFEADARDRIRRDARERIAEGWLDRPGIRMDSSYRAFLERVRDEDARAAAIPDPPRPPPR